MRTYKDTDIREALRRKFADTPQVPADLNKRVLQNSLTASPSQTRRSPLLWRRWGRLAAAVLVAVVALFTWKSHTPKTQPQMAKQESAPKVIEKDSVDKSPSQHVMIANTARYDDQHNTLRSKTSQPKKKNRKAVKAEEPMIAEAEPLPEEPETTQEYLPTEPDPFLLAAAEAQDIRARGERLFQEVAQIINH